MQITLGQQYNVGEKPSVILYIYIIINRHTIIADDLYLCIELVSMATTYL